MAPPPGEQMSFFGSWADDDNASCGKFMENSKLLAFEVLKAWRGDFSMDFWRYRQLHHFIAQHGRAIRDMSSLTPFEHLFIAEEPIPHMISKLYELLGSVTPDTKPLFVQAWERDLGLEFSEAQLTHLYQITHFSSLDSKMQETNYKLLSRW